MRQLAEWFKATLVDDDWRARLKALPGAAFTDGVSQSQFWRDEETVRSHIDLRTRLGGMTTAAYAEERFGFVQSRIWRLGVPPDAKRSLLRPLHGRMKAEMEYLDIFFQREGGKMEEGPHPDSVGRRWAELIDRVSRDQVSRILGTEYSQEQGRGPDAGGGPLNNGRSTAGSPTRP